MMRSQRRFVRGKCGHVLGEVRHVKFEAVKLRALMLYETSTQEEPAELPPLRGQVIGMYAICCTVCQSVRDWRMEEDALSELFENRNARRSVVAKNEETVV